MKILALDMGGTTGYAVFDGGSLIESGTKKFDFQKDRGWRNLKNFILEITKRFNVDGVVYEEPPLYLKGGASINLLKYCGALVLTVIDLVRVPIYSLQPCKIKKFVTGKGNADKEVVMQEVSKIFNYDFTSHDEADAIACGITFILDYIDESSYESNNSEVDVDGDKAGQQHVVRPKRGKASRST